MPSLSGIAAVFRRELRSYFLTPLASVFIVVFLVLAGAMTFYLGAFFERGQADLRSFFQFHPWLYLVFLPAVAMRLWSEERRSGTIELLMTLPLETGELVLGKFLAAWAFAGLTLGLTLPFWVTVTILGDPDHGVIAASYLGSLFMAGAYLAIGAALSAMTRNQVVAFVLAVAVSFLFTVSGLPMVLDLVAWAPRPVGDFIASTSFLIHFDSLTQGIVDLRSVVYFASLIALWLWVNAIAVERIRTA